MSLLPPHPPQSLLISILLPVANGAEYLFESLSSVLQQTHANWECLIVLNGVGLEGPAKAVAEAFGDTRIRILELSTVTNKVAALNAAAKEAKGEWIALLDVDDRWHPLKLAQQVTALQTLQPAPAVIGTRARYFGEFQGIPAIPTGWITLHQLADTNPIINSSALIHKDWAEWKYHPEYPQTTEDYYLWMCIALQGGALFVVPECLVDHRIHKASAFNGKDPSPIALQQWFLQQKQQQQQPLTILTTVCNNPDFLRAQHAALVAYVPRPWRFIVFNDAKAWPDATNFGDPTMPQQIEVVCRELGISCIPVPNEAHRHITSASHRHCDTLRHVMRWIRSSPKGRYWMLDSDMWPVAPYTPAELAQRFKGAGTFVQQQRGNTTYAWPNLWWLDTTQTDSTDLCWDLAPHCDTGGASAPWIQRKSSHITWLPLHKSSGRWTMAELPVGAQAVAQFVAADPRNPRGKGGPLWSELYDGDRIFHIRAASNWNGEGSAVHQQVAALVKSFFA